MSDSIDDGLSEAQEGSELHPLADVHAAIGVQLFEGSRFVTARGTEDGLILRIDGRAEWSDVLTELDQFLGGRKKFFEGGEVSVEWLDRLPTKEQSEELEGFLRNNYGLEISNRAKKKTAKSEQVADESVQKKRGVTIPLFEEVADLESAQALKNRIEVEKPSARGSAPSSDRLFAEVIASLGHSPESTGNEAKRSLSNLAKVLGEDAFFDDDANAKVVFSTLRSGQRIETPFSLVVVGDVNPGADLVAGGDIVVLGSLRGTAHAGAYDDDCFDKVIIALQMQPMQLRIGSVISRGSDEKVSGVEIARIDNRRIVVEAFNPRSSSAVRRSR